MDSNITVMIVLQILTLVSTAIAPLILAVSGCIKNIKKSDCCGSRVELATQNEPSPMPNPHQTV